MSEFSRIWDTEVKKLAQNCIQEPRLVQLMAKGENYKPNEEEKEYLKSIEGKYKDAHGMYYISYMISQVEHALADSREAVAGLAILSVYEVLNRSSYFQNVFNGNENDKEWKTRAALRDGLSKLLNV